MLPWSCTPYLDATSSGSSRDGAIDWSTVVRQQKRKASGLACLEVGDGGEDDKQGDDVPMR